MKRPFLRLKHRLISRAAGLFPSLEKRLVESYKPVEFDKGKFANGKTAAGIPWSALTKPLNECRLMLVTTSGVHHRTQPPFDMNDPMGDPTLRIISADADAAGLTVTHDYYDHRDADKDLNVVFPLWRLKEFSSRGVIGGMTDVHLSFMGHIDGPHIETLIEKTAPEAARLAVRAGADCVILTPG
jgi:D-proline reductase (dithiol) PrdB